MEYTTLGKTGLTVSVAGLGCGGNSRVGQGTGLSAAQSVDLVREAFDLGVTFFDTAATYGTEEIVGRAFSSAERGTVVISTKSPIRLGGEPMSAAHVVSSLEGSLRRLSTDYVDVFMLHGVRPNDYDHAEQQIKPALLAEKAKGKIRCLGLSETPPNDPGHEMLQRALADPSWQVVMLAYHMLNQNARREVFPRTRPLGVGTLLMFVVRNIFSRPGVLAETVRQLAAGGRVPAELAASEDPLSFLVHAAGADSLIDAAYRFARHEPGGDVVLFGTSSSEHLKSNIASILRPPLPKADVERLYQLFGALQGVGLDLPDYVKQLLKN